MSGSTRSGKNQPERLLSDVLLRGDPAGWLGYSPGPLDADEVLAAWRRALARRGSPEAPRTLQLYTHFAFCRMSCRFCQYWHVLVREDAELEAYTDHLIALARLYRERLGRVRVSNAYFGGGTPTALTTPMLRRFLDAFRDAFEVTHEHTTEAHPSTLDAEKIAVLADGGINRISMGLQSFDEAVLHHVGRSNGPTESVRSTIEQARARGILVNVDLILGLPAQTAASFANDVRETLELEPDTITVYRYQPVHRLPGAPTEAMRYSRALWRLLPRCAAARYLPLGPLGDGAYSVLLVRASARTARYAASNIASAVRSTLGQAELPRYTDVDRDDVDLIGLGPGAVSHLVGFGWYRDVTAVRHATGRAAPTYWGTRLDDEGELRSRTLLALGRGDWVDEQHLARHPLGRDLAAVLEAGVARGVLRRALRWVKVRPAAAPEDRTAVLRELLPHRPLDRETATATLAFKLRTDVQPELVDVDRVHREHAT